MYFLSVDKSEKRTHVGFSSDIGQKTVYDQPMDDRTDCCLLSDKMCAMNGKYMPSPCINVETLFII